MFFMNMFTNKELVYTTYVFIISIVGFVTMGIDKFKSTREQWRIKELTLLLVAFFGGAIGILFGMVIFKHKINKKKFAFGVPFLYLCNRIIEKMIVFYFFTK